MNSRLIFRFYVPVTTFAFWEVQVSGISLNSQAIGSTSHLGECAHRATFPPFPATAFWSAAPRSSNSVRTVPGSLRPCALASPR
jgi:hypothetical protein